MSYDPCPKCGEPLYDGGGFDGKTPFCNNVACDNKLGSKPLPPDMLPRPRRSQKGKKMRRAFKGIR